MKKLLPLLLGSVLALGAVGCEDVAKTSSSAPNSTNDNGGQLETQNNQNDATKEVRQSQIESDTRARQQRNDAAGNPGERDDDDVESLVRNKLETRLPSSQLAVDAEEGVVTVTGKVASQQELSQVETIALEVPGVTRVNVQATVGTPEELNNQNNSDDSDDKPTTAQ